jgi:hypothetical protein
MDRRTFLTGLGAAALSAKIFPAAAQGQLIPAGVAQFSQQQVNSMAQTLLSASDSQINGMMEELRAHPDLAQRIRDATPAAESWLINNNTARIDGAKKAEDKLGRQIERMRGDNSAANAIRSVEATAAAARAKNDRDPVTGPYMEQARTDLTGAQQRAAGEIASRANDVRAALDGLLQSIGPSGPGRQSAVHQVLNA